jgi:hypothetical protein
MPIEMKQSRTYCVTGFRQQILSLRVILYETKCLLKGSTEYSTEIHWKFEPISGLLNRKVMHNRSGNCRSARVGSNAHSLNPYF